jgi:hypothetical protein
MSKGKLEFDLSDFDDKMEFERCIKSTDMAIVLFDVIYNYKKSLEYDIEKKEEDGKTPTPYEVLDMFFEKFNNDLSRRGIEIDNLIR